MSTFRTDDGVRIAYREWNRGSRDAVPLLLLHGFPLHQAVWNRVVAPLAKHGPVITMDQRGFGESAVPAGPYTMERLARDVAQLLEHLEVSSAFVAGHSMGGYVALALADLEPGKVGGLALVHSHPFADDEAARQQRYQVAAEIMEGDREPWNRTMTDRLLGQDAGENVLFQEVLAMVEQAGSMAVAAASVGMALRPYRAHVWRRFHGSSLHVSGERDKILPLKKALDTQVERPRGQHVILDAAHCSMLEAPGDLARALLSWWNPGAR